MLHSVSDISFFQYGIRSEKISQQIKDYKDSFTLYEADRSVAVVDQWIKTRLPYESSWFNLDSDF